MHTPDKKSQLVFSAKLVALQCKIFFFLLNTHICAKNLRLLPFPVSAPNVLLIISATRWLLCSYIPVWLPSMTVLRLEWFIKWLRITLQVWLVPSQQIDLIWALSCLRQVTTSFQVHPRMQALDWRKWWSSWTTLSLTVRVRGYILTQKQEYIYNQTWVKYVCKVLECFKCISVVSITCIWK